MSSSNIDYMHCPRRLVNGGNGSEEDGSIYIMHCKNVVLFIPKLDARGMKLFKADANCTRNVTSTLKRQQVRILARRPAHALNVKYVAAYYDGGSLEYFFMVYSLEVEEEDDVQYLGIFKIESENEPVAVHGKGKGTGGNDALADSYVIREVATERRTRGTNHFLTYQTLFSCFRECRGTSIPSFIMRKNDRKVIVMVTYQPLRRKLRFRDIHIDDADTVDHFTTFGSDGQYALGVAASSKRDGQRALTIFRKKSITLKLSYQSIATIDIDPWGCSNIRDIHALSSSSLLDFNAQDNDVSNNDNDSGRLSTSIISFIIVYDDSRLSDSYSIIYKVDASKESGRNVIRQRSMQGNLLDISDDERSCIVRRRDGGCIDDGSRFLIDVAKGEWLEKCIGDSACTILNNCNLMHFVMGKGAYTSSIEPCSNVADAIIASANFGLYDDLIQLTDAEIASQVKSIRVEPSQCPGASNYKFTIVNSEDGSVIEPSSVSSTFIQPELFKRHTYKLYKYHIKQLLDTRIASHKESAQVYRAQYMNHVTEQASRLCNLRFDNMETLLVLNADAYSQCMFAQFHEKKQNELQTRKEQCEAFTIDNFHDLLNLKNELESGKSGSVSLDGDDGDDDDDGDGDDGDDGDGDKDDGDDGVVRVEDIVPLDQDSI